MRTCWPFPAITASRQRHCPYPPVRPPRASSAQRDSGQQRQVILRGGALASGRLCLDAGGTGHELAALDLVQTVAAAGPAGASPAALNEDLAEAEQWDDTERASRLLAEKAFLVRELAAATGPAATGLGGRPRRLGTESERARRNVTRAIRSAIARIRDRAPAAAAHLDQAVRTGTRCSYSPPGEPS
jgi:hypothetical protein